jgi:SAM-dependent methyltransferase
MNDADDKSVRLFFELFSNLPRQGPGTAESTRKALELIPPLSPGSRLLDLGCGTGAQTMVLADATPARIVAIDSHAPFIKELSANVTAQGLNDRVEARVADMAHLDLPDQPFDVIWAEGSIYLVGFDRGLQEWRRFLKEGGHIAATEVCWLRPGVPQECRDYWAEQYPAVRDVSENLLAIERAGYRVTGHFPLPPEAWWDYYYVPLQRNLETFSARHAGDAYADEIISATQTEMGMYQKYSDFYGYVFFVMRRPASPASAN